MVPAAGVAPPSSSSSPPSCVPQQLERQQCQYALLLPGGLELPSIEILQEFGGFDDDGEDPPPQQEQELQEQQEQYAEMVPPTRPLQYGMYEYELAPEPELPGGYVLGQSGAYRALLLRGRGSHRQRSDDDADDRESSSSSAVAGGAVLSPRLRACPCVSASLIVVASGIVDTTAPTATDLIAPAIPRDNVKDAVELLKLHRPELSRRREEDPPVITFGVATLRGGQHASGVTSVAVSAAVADALVDETEGGNIVPGPCSDWKVDLSSPSVRVICLLQHSQLLVGFLLPPVPPDRLSVSSARAVPRIVREYIPVECMKRPHMAPTVAAALVKLSGLKREERLLDPCGGLGIVCIEAARMLGIDNGGSSSGRNISPDMRHYKYRCVSIDVDPEATALASQNSTLARTTDTINVITGDALDSHFLVEACGGLQSIDVVITDLPYGRFHPKLDVAALLRSLWSAVKPGGRALLTGACGTDDSVVKCAAESNDGSRWKGGVVRCPWTVVDRVKFAMGGHTASAVLLLRVGKVEEMP